jgi:NitT/TauT family transport system substrate-binding protein
MLPKIRGGVAMLMHYVASVALAAALLAPNGIARADDLPRIRIGYVVTPPELQPILFAKAGVAPHLGKTYSYEAVHFQATPAMITALASGDLDVVPFTFPTLAIAIQNAGMKDIRVFADEFQDGRDDYYSERYMVLKDSGIDKVEDLKGKVVASNAIGSGVDMAMRTMLKKHGLEDRRDYSTVEVGFPNMKAVLLEGKVALISEPVVFAYDPELLQKAKLLFTEKEAMGHSQFAIWAAREPYIQKNRAALVDFMEDTLRALRWFYDPKHHDEAAQIVAQFSKQPVERLGWVFTKRDVYRAPDGMPDLKALQANIDTQKQLGFLKDDIDIAQYVDLSIVKEANQRLK